MKKYKHLNQQQRYQQFKFAVVYVEIIYYFCEIIPSIRRNQYNIYHYGFYNYLL